MRGNMWFLNKMFEVRNVLEKMGILDFASEMCFTYFFSFPNRKCCNVKEDL